MPSDPVLSVVIPAHDIVAFVDDTLRSVELNTDVDLQLVVVDDGSRDGTGAALDRFAATRPWVEVITHETAQGPAAARNAGLDRATGRYVTFLDGDDWVAPGYLGRLVAAIEALRSDFVRVDHVQATGRERVVQVAPEGRRDVVLDPRSGILPLGRRTMVDYPYPPMGIYRRELGELLRFRPELHTAEDRLWTWRLHLHADTYAVTSLAGMFYRRAVATSLTQIGDERQLHFVDAFAEILRETGGQDEYSTKALRQFLAILVNQLGRAEERLSPALRDQLDRRSRTLLAGADPALLQLAMPTDARAATLAPYLPAELAS